jgi:hypothetical protein
MSVPSTISSATDESANTSVFESEVHQRLSCQRRTVGSSPAQRVTIPPASSTRLAES